VAAYAASNLRCLASRPIWKISNIVRCDPPGSSGESIPGTV
jgi:hypothetical protein